MPNHLAHENSPYLLQHAENPVNWYPWGEEALQKAQIEDKPIFLSIGYAACHWCHVMAHESFEDPETAALMNEYFVNIKVDREERPELDNIYMAAVVALTGQGGWPMSLFLTPNGEPFYGGTYFPPAPRYQMPSFKDILVSIARIWKEDRTKLLQAGNQVSQHIKQELELSTQSIQPAPALQSDTLVQAAQALVKSYDWTHGGWGRAPKFPQPMLIEFLLRMSTRGNQAALEVATHALQAMAKGGMYDVVGGGFARYSTDEYWRVPHFEKMLYDNAQLSRAYLHAYLLSRQPDFVRVCEQTLDFVQRELADAAGGFYSSLDADTQGVEGKYYVWDAEEIHKLIPNPQDNAFFTAAYPVTEQGNFEGQNVLQRALTNSELAEKFQMPVEKVQSRLDHLLQVLFEARQKRTRPGTDDKVLVAWNGLMLASFAEAARYLDRRDYLDIAIHNADFLLTQMIVDGRLMRSWRNGQARHLAYLEDYAALIMGLLALYQSDPNARWYQAATSLLEQVLQHFTDPLGGFFDTSDEAKSLLVRPKEMQDNATPSGTSLAALGLIDLAALTGNGEWRDRAETMLTTIQPLATRYPTGYGEWLVALDQALGPVLEVAILGDLQKEQTRKLENALWSTYRPRLVSAQAGLPVPEAAPPLLFDRTLKDNQPTAYVCQGFVCRMPVSDPRALEQLLDSPK